MSRATCRYNRSGEDNCEASEVCFPFSGPWKCYQKCQRGRCPPDHSCRNVGIGFLLVSICVTEDDEASTDAAASEGNGASSSSSFGGFDSVISDSKAASGPARQSVRKTDSTSAFTMDGLLMALCGAFFLVLLVFVAKMLLFRGGTQRRRAKQLRYEETYI